MLCGKGRAVLELLLTRKENKILSILADERRLLQIHAQTEVKDQRTAVVGDIYVGKVRNVVKNINAEIGRAHV